ncbi:hypothetical protein CHX23_23570 [Rhodococcoides fascians]|nr:hypothetical protein CHX23_23570 [Rhodococcus fascians]
MTGIGWSAADSISRSVSARSGSDVQAVVRSTRGRRGKVKLEELGRLPVGVHSRASRYTEI